MTCRRWGLMWRRLLMGWPTGHLKFGLFPERWLTQGSGYPNGSPNDGRRWNLAFSTNTPDGLRVPGWSMTEMMLINAARQLTLCHWKVSSCHGFIVYRQPSMQRPQQNYSSSHGHSASFYISQTAQIANLWRTKQRLKLHLTYLVNSTDILCENDLFRDDWEVINSEEFCAGAKRGLLEEEGGNRDRLCIKVTSQDDTGVAHVLLQKTKAICTFQPNE